MIFLPILFGSAIAVPAYLYALDAIIILYRPGGL